MATLPYLILKSSDAGKSVALHVASCLYKRLNYLHSEGHILQGQI